MRRVMRREFTPLADQSTHDGVGSVIAQHGTSGPTVTLDAYMDELGGMVRRVTPADLQWYPVRRHRNRARLLAPIALS
ncbi:hypothetical protein [Sphingomonas sp. 10B4]|uniref:hypothetical protein n=2 Tax=Sphingomonas sp. 10B4 TaxID=3048575 RepID=UPI002B223E5E|nr:hypothetical protein [Sphingomonas sp. 10B4]MEB0283734.1 hypothetical protein [Sphingomonas sp. 10B4]